MAGIQMDPVFLHSRCANTPKSPVASYRSQTPQCTIYALVYGGPKRFCDHPQCTITTLSPAQGGSRPQPIGRSESEYHSEWLTHRLTIQIAPTQSSTYVPTSLCRTCDRTASALESGFALRHTKHTIQTSCALSTREPCRQNKPPIQARTRRPQCWARSWPTRRRQYCVITSLSAANTCI